MAEQVKKAFVIGYPIAHSLSPHLHSFWIRQYGINGSYEKLEIHPDQLGEFLAGINDSAYVGGNITLPHKEAAYQLTSEHSQTADQLKAINTVWIEQGKLQSDNTDSYGFSANLDEFAPQWRHRHIAMVLGAGGAAKSIVHALLKANYRKIFVANRTLSRAQELARQFGDNCIALEMGKFENELASTELLINTTALGMKGQNPLEIDLTPLPREAIVSDIVYNPLDTDLLLQAKRLGLVSVDGIGMLLHQAVPGFERWFGIRPEVTPELRKYMLAKLGGKNLD